MKRRYHLVRNSGLYQWDATVAAALPGKPPAKLLLWTFCDTRAEAVEDVCQQAIDRGYINPTVDHITRAMKS